MRILVQRVKCAKVHINRKVFSSIDNGMLLFVGIGVGDTIDDIKLLAKKIANLRIFSDTQGKMNLNINEVDGKVLSVPQFTLYADIRKGNRPGFESSAGSDLAKDYRERFNSLLEENDIEVYKGEFGASMEVELVNDGPVTLWLDSKT